MSEVQLSRDDLEDLEFIRELKRASQGLSLTEKDVMAFLVNAEDHRERTRLKEHDCYSHSGWEFLASIYPKTFGFLLDLAKIENIYFISLDGLQRQEAILMTKAKTTAQTPLTIENISQPVQPTQPQQQQESKGRSLLHPFRKAQ
jgi:hypothetical protein